MTRTDIHRPSAIVPTDYDFVAFEYQKIESFGDCVRVQQDRAIIKAHMERTGGKYATHAHGGNCHICGAGAIYTVLFYHSLSNSYIRTGQDCAEKLSMSYGDMNTFRSAVREAMGAAKGKRAAVAKWTEAGLARALELREERQALPAIVGLALQPEDFISREREDAAWAEVRKRNREWANVDKLAELIQSTEKYGTLSDKMIAFAKSLLEKHENAGALAAQRDAEKAAAAPCPTGRVEIAGTIVKVDTRETQWGLTTKMLVKSDAGFMVWSTLPSGAPCERGAAIKFKATVTPAPDDPKFGFASRPAFIA